MRLCHGSCDAWRASSPSSSAQPRVPAGHLVLHRRARTEQHAQQPATPVAAATLRASAAEPLAGALAVLADRLLLDYVHRLGAVISGIRACYEIQTRRSRYRHNHAFSGDDIEGVQNRSNSLATRLDSGRGRTRGTGLPPSRGVDIPPCALAARRDGECRSGRTRRGLNDGRSLLDLKQGVGEHGVGVAVSADADDPDEHIGLRGAGDVHPRRHLESGGVHVHRWTTGPPSR